MIETTSKPPVAQRAGGIYIYIYIPIKHFVQVWIIAPRPLAVDAICLLLMVRAVLDWYRLTSALVRQAVVHVRKDILRIVRVRFPKLALLGRGNRYCLKLTGSVL